MTKLEFINELIKERKESKDRFILAFERYSDDEVVTRCIKDREQEIQILEQIKNDLEAWEVVKKNLKVYPDETIRLETKEWMTIYTNYKDQYQILKKALEVKDET